MTEGSDHPLANTECPRCHKKYKSLGRHKRFCKGEGAAETYSHEKFELYTAAIEDNLRHMREHLKNLETERNHYKREYHQLAEWRGRLGNLMKGVDIDK